MKSYELKKYTNGNNNIEMIRVSLENKTLFVIELSEIENISKDELIEDYINFEAFIKGEEANYLYKFIIDNYKK